METILSPLYQLFEIVGLPIGSLRLTTIYHTVPKGPRVVPQGYED
jgi:hypothetical protein